MSNINFTIRKVFPGTEPQKNVGIMATFTMTVDGPDGIILQLNDMKLMKTREGDRFYIDSPFRSYETKGQDGNMEKRKMNYIKLFPEEKNWDKQDAIVRLVLAEIDKAGTNKGTGSKPQASSKPAAPSNRTSPSPRPQPSVQNNDPW